MPFKILTDGRRTADDGRKSDEVTKIMNYRFKAEQFRQIVLLPQENSDGF